MRKKNFDSKPFIYDAKGDVKGRWHVEYRNKDGKRIKVYGDINKYKTKEGKRKAAQAILSEIDLADVGNGKYFTMFTKFLESKRKRVEAGYLAKKTYQGYRAKVRTLLSYIEAEEVKVFDKIEANRFLDWLIEEHLVNPTTRNDYRRHLGHLFSYLEKRGFYHENPFVKTDKIRQTPETCLHFSREQIELLKQEIIPVDYQLWIAIQLQYYCFLRPVKEIRMIKVSDIILSEKRILVRKEVSKNKLRQSVQIPSPLVASLADYIDGAYLSDFLISHGGKPGRNMLGQNNLTNRHRKHLQNLGLLDHKFYSWKNTG